MTLTPAWTKLRYHELQSAAWRTNKRFVILPCGRGSGKTDISRRRVVRMLPVRKDWIDPLYFYALPTFQQARRVAWKPIRDLIPQDWILKISESEMMVHTVFNSRLYVVGMDKPHRIEGVQWDGGVVDESSDQKPGAVDRSIMPALSHRDGWLWRIGVPKRFGVGAKEFKHISDIGASGNDPDVVTYAWPSSDILTPEQLEAAQRLLDARDFNEQYNAQWETAGGAIFHAFSATNLMQCEYDRDKPIVVGSDFNVDPMCWVVGHIVGDHLLIFDEIFIRNTNTQQTLNELHRRYGKHEMGWEFYGDASGRARKTSAATSDYIQIKNDTRFKGRKVYYLKSNPFIADRFAACNAMFRNAQGRRRCFIHPRCRHLIDDIESRQYKEGSREPDDYGDVGHMSDALGYIVFRRFPVRIIQTGSPTVVTS